MKHDRYIGTAKQRLRFRGKISNNNTLFVSGRTHGLLVYKAAEATHILVVNFEETTGFISG